MNIIEELEWRGLINDITNKELLDEMIKNPIKLYCGVDPTADSMHIGHLLPIIVLKRFYQHNHIPIPLMGGATGQIGDPSGRNSERSLLDNEQIKYNVQCIYNQVAKILDVENNQLVIANNLEWTQNLSVLDFLRDYGKHFNINTMLAKDTVSSRLETGISFTEFSYSILQSLDWLKLYENYGVTMQIGGSDQWGNITAGLDLLRKKHPESKCVGLTIPLVTKSDGTKFGKSVSGAIWLDPKKTSPYEFYQFLLNTADSDVIQYLKYFTFLTKEEILAIEEDLKNNPHLRLAQKTLAKELTTMVHSIEEYEKAILVSEALFSGNIKDLDIEIIKNSFDGVLTSTLDNDQYNIVDFLVESKVCSSKREAREFVGNNSIMINGVKINDLEYVVDKCDCFDQQFAIIRRGKKNYFKVVFN